jgi:hypothetical protein
MATRPSEDYRAYYREQLEEGQAYQDFVCERLHAEGIVLQPFNSRQAQLTALHNEIQADQP